MNQIRGWGLDRVEINSGTRCCIILLWVAILFLSACTKTVIPTKPPPPAPKPKPYKVFGKWYQPLPDARGFSQRGIASWYGKDFHGKKTANGEVYDMYAMTAAHKTLPLGTHVRVRHLENNREIDVRINDRGPFVRGRVIDLSYTGAKRLGIVGPGTAPVEVIALGGSPRNTASGKKYAPLDYYTGSFTIQVGAFQNLENADRLRAKLSESYPEVHVSAYQKGSDTFYRVRVGKFTDLTEADKNETALIHKGFSDAFTVAE